MPELNCSYRQLSFDQGDHPKLLFGDNLRKQIKDISETNKVRFAISRTPSIPSSTISISPHKSPQNKIQPSFLYWGRRISVYAGLVAPIPSKLQKAAEPMVPIRQEVQLKSKTEMPAHCDTLVRKIKDIKISNKKFKAGNIASCLSK